MKTNFAPLLFTLTCTLGVPRVIAQDDSSDIHKRLSTPGYDSRHDYNRMVFVGEIIALGVVFQGVCKQPVNQNIDFRVSEILLGDPPEPRVRAGYINCTGEPLPSPPFTLHGKVIVYCFQSAGFKCLAPVAFTEERLKAVKSWIAKSRAANHNSPS